MTSLLAAWAGRTLPLGGTVPAAGQKGSCVGGMSPKERDDPVRTSVDERENSQRWYGGDGDEQEHRGHQRKDRDALGGYKDAWRDCKHGNRGLLNLGKTGDLRLLSGAIVRPVGRMSPQVTRGQLPVLSTDRGDDGLSRA